MRFILITLTLLTSACNTATEGRQIPDAERESVMKEQDRKQACMTTSNSNDEYIKCVGPIKHR